MMRVLESVLARDIAHPGACHHYIHLVEAGPAPERAEACADHLGNAIPGAFVVFASAYLGVLAYSRLQPRLPH